MILRSIARVAALGAALAAFAGCHTTEYHNGHHGDHYRSSGYRGSPNYYYSRDAYRAYSSYRPVGYRQYTGYRSDGYVEYNGYRPSGGSRYVAYRRY